jgi:menaquinone reductase, multiheme cytochrome c subunit
MKYRGSMAVLTGMATALFAGWYVFPQLLYSSRTQPVAFSHKAHIDKAGVKCEDCHSLGADGAFSGIPRLEKCAGCHASPMTQSAEEKLLIDRYITPNREIPWLAYARQPDNAYFSHAVHLKAAGLACERCHGRHGSTGSLRPYQENRITGYSRDIWGHSISRISFRPQERPAMKMDDCVTCHRERNVETSCIACHR